ncbi:unnamed protein product, partial [Ectocarpus sp. 12 AP-2014]
MIDKCSAQNLRISHFTGELEGERSRLACREPCGWIKQPKTNDRMVDGAKLISSARTDAKNIFDAGRTHGLGAVPILPAASLPHSLTHHKRSNLTMMKIGRKIV